MAIWAWCWKTICTIIICIKTWFLPLANLVWRWWWKNPEWENPWWTNIWWKNPWKNSPLAQVKISSLVSISQHPWTHVDGIFKPARTSECEFLHQFFRQITTTTTTTILHPTQNILCWERNHFYYAYCLNNIKKYLPMPTTILFIFTINYPSCCNFTKFLLKLINIIFCNTNKNFAIFQQQHLIIPTNYPTIDMLL